MTEDQQDPQDLPRTVQHMPVVAVIELHGRKLHVSHVPERKTALVQILDFYPEIIRRTAKDWEVA
jgi:hypothetical protein